MATPLTRVEIVQNRFNDYLATAKTAAKHLAPTDPLRSDSKLTAKLALEILKIRSQAACWILPRANLNDATKAFTPSAAQATKTTPLSEPRCG